MTKTKSSMKEYVSTFKDKVIRNDSDFFSINVFQQGIFELEKWGAAFFLSQLENAFLFQNQSEIHDIDEILFNSHALPKYKKSIQSVIEILEKHKFLSRITIETYERTQYKYSTDYNPEQALKKIIQQFPTVKINAEFLYKTISYYFDVIAGKSRFLNLLFPSGSFEIIEHIYKKNPDAAYFNQIAASFLANYIESNHTRTVSILEIGAGIGSTTEKALPLLSKKRLCHEYLYTDVSRTFLNYAEKKFKNSYPFLTTSIYDIEKPRTEHLTNTKFDIIIATNVLHISKSILSCIENIKSLLKPNGILIINEGIKKIDYSTLIYSLSDGWWNFQDNKWRIHNSPFITLDNWKKLLYIAGFSEVSSLNEALLPNIHYICQDVIIARS